MKREPLDCRFHNNRYTYIHTVHTYIHADRQTDRQTDRQMGRQTYLCTNMAAYCIHTDRHIYVQTWLHTTYTHTYKHIYRQTDRHGVGKQIHVNNHNIVGGNVCNSLQRQGHVGIIFNVVRSDCVLV